MPKNRICSIKECDKPVYGHGWCITHYTRWRRNGDPNKIIRQANGSLLPFLMKAIQTNTNQCIIWPYGKNTDGYGRVTAENKRWLAHRYALYLATDECPRDKQAAHKCGNAACVNTKHLYWASNKENCADKKEHGTQTYGEEHHSAILREKDVLMIRKDTRSYAKIAKAYNVSIGCIQGIKERSTWKHV